jgi:hypothetical protein
VVVVSAERITTSAGVYVTALGAVEELGADVTAHMVRAWARRDHLEAVTVGRRVYYPLTALVKAEADANENRATLGGRPRRGILTSA